MTAVCCTTCDWTGYTYSLNDLQPQDLRGLEPGSPVPYGRCPECDAFIPFNAPATDSLHPQFGWEFNRAERSNLSQFQRDCILIALAMLTPDHPGFNACNSIEVAFRSTIGSEIPIPDDRAPPFNRLTLDPYLSSWVRPVLIGALYGELFPGQRDYVRDDAARIRSALKKGGEE